MSSSVCSAVEIAEKRRIALEKLHAKKTQMQSAASSKMAAAARKLSKGASSFLNSMSSNFFAHRDEVREAAHPYQRLLASKSNTPKPLVTLTAKSARELVHFFAQRIHCKVYIVSRQRFVVHPSSFHAKLFEVFSTIPSKSYNPNTGVWSFAIADYQLVHRRVFALKPDIGIGFIPKEVMTLCLAPVRKPDRSCLAKIERTLAEKLLPFQQEGVCFTIAQRGRVMICDEMGLGKTYEALAVADFYREDWPLLICTTASARESWASHIRELLPSIPLPSVQVLTNNQQNIGDARILITSYSMIEKHMSTLMERRFGFLIFDESHMLKNNKAKCTVVADRLAKQAKHVVLLSGTPALSRPLELFTQLKMIDRKFMNFKDFTRRYCDGTETRYGWDATGQSYLEELNVMLKVKYMLRRTKTDVLPELAEKFRETVVLDPALVWTNDGSRETLDNYSQAYSISTGRAREDILLLFYSETAKIKTRAVCAYLKTLLKEKVKFIVFAHHRVMMDAICDCLLELEVNFVRIDGRTRNDARAEHINTFQTRSACRVAVLSIRACNSGITLTAAEMIIFAELDWNPSTLAQAESRAHRIGQNKPVICRYLMASETADDIIWSLLKSKQDVLNKAGLFCEDLRDATHTTAPTISDEIEQYFSPNEANSCARDESTTNSACASTSNAQPTNSNTASSLNLVNELEHIDDFFNDNDDEIFKDLKF